MAIFRNSDSGLDDRALALASSLMRSTMSAVFDATSSATGVGGAGGMGSDDAWSVYGGVKHCRWEDNVRGESPGVDGPEASEAQLTTSMSMGTLVPSGVGGNACFRQCFTMSLRASLFVGVANTVGSSSSSDWLLGTTLVGADAWDELGDETRTFLRGLLRRG